MKAICECVYTTAMNNTPTDFKNAVSTDNSKFKPYLFSAIAVVALRSGIIGIFFFVMIVVTAPFRCRLLLRHRNEVGVQQVIPQRFRRRLLVLFSTLHAFGLLGRGILSKQLPSRTSFPTSRRHDVTVNVTIKTLQQQTLCKSQRAPPPRTASPATHGFNKNKRGWARLGEGRGGGKQHGSLLWLGRPAARRSGSSRRHSARPRLGSWSVVATAISRSENTRTESCSSRVATTLYFKRKRLSYLKRLIGLINRSKRLNQRCGSITINRFAERFSSINRLIVRRFYHP